MKRIVNKLIPVALVLIMVFVCTTAMFILADEETGTEEANASDTGIVFEENETAQAIYASSSFIPSDELDADFEPSDGLTVIYGSNLSVEDIFTKKSYDEVLSLKKEVCGAAESDTDTCYVYDEATDSYVYYEDDAQTGQSGADTTGSDDGTDDDCVTPESNTFIVMCMQNGKRRDVEYVSVSYEDSVDISVIDALVASYLADDMLTSRVKDFICEQVGTVDSAYYGTLSTSASSTIVMQLRDTNYHIANYTVSSTSYPVMVYKKNITYRAALVSNTLEDCDPYIISASVTITPGSDITSSEAAEYSSLSASGIYNDKYSSKVRILAAKTYYENLFPDQDYYVSMSPMSSITDVNGRTFTISLSPGGVSLSFDLNLSTSATVNLVTDFEPEGTSYVMFVAEKGLLVSYPTISEEKFSYNSAVDFSSGYSTLYTNVGTNIKYYFKGTDPDTVTTWWGTTKEFYYENN